MADKFQREIPLEDTGLVVMVEEKGKLVTEGRALATRMEELAKQHDELVAEMGGKTTQLNELKLRIIGRVREIAADQLTEFEIPVTTELKDGKVHLIVTEGLEEFKDSFKNFDKWSQPVPRKEKKLETSA